MADTCHGPKGSMSEARSPCNPGFYVIYHHSPAFQPPSLPTAAHARHPGSHRFRANTDNESTRTSSSLRSHNVTVRLAMDGARSSSDHSLLRESRLAPVRLTSSPVMCPRSIWVSDNAAEDLIVAMDSHIPAKRPSGMDSVLVGENPRNRRRRDGRFGLDMG
jgi:hypothetical protein